jgi:hypothetical protein
MSGTLPPQAHQMLVRSLEALRTELERLYWQASKRDALEGQRLKVTVGPYTVQFQMDNEGEWGIVQWGLKPMTGT